MENGFGDGAGAHAVPGYGRIQLNSMRRCVAQKGSGASPGSPVLNENGELIGCAFDGNWESLSGDINFDNNLQRCINLDIRYVLFILEKLGNCGHLINEMTIVE